MDTSYAIQQAERELERLKLALSLGPLTFDEWFAGCSEKEKRFIVPISFYGKTSNEWDREIDWRLFVDHHNPRGFLPGHQPVCLKGSRVALIKNDPMRFVSKLHARLIKRQRKTIVWRKDVYDYTRELTCQIGRYLDRKGIYCHSRSFDAATRIGYIGLDKGDEKERSCANILFKGKELFLDSPEKIAAVMELFTVANSFNDFAKRERAL